MLTKSLPLSVNITIPLSLISPLQRLQSSYQIIPRYCRTEISDKVPCGKYIQMYGDEKDAETLVEVIKLLQLQLINIK
jgi:hypothetical protein